MEQAISIQLNKKLEEDIIKKHAVLMCKECGILVEKKDKCLCRPHLCYRCCNCGLDCDLCSCSVKSK